VLRVLVNRNLDVSQRGAQRKLPVWPAFDPDSLGLPMKCRWYSYSLSRKAGPLRRGFTPPVLDGATVSDRFHADFDLCLNANSSLGKQLRLEAQVFRRGARHSSQESASRLPSIIINLKMCKSMHSDLHRCAKFCKLVILERSGAE